MERGAALSSAEIQNLPELISKPKAVFYQAGIKNDKKADALVYVLDLGQGKLGKVVVNPQYSNTAQVAGKRKKIKTNDIRTAGQIAKEDIETDTQSRNWEIIEGEL